MNIFNDLIETRKAGKACGLYSVCSSQPAVLDAAFMRASKSKHPVLIEATANQVNQYGGYNLLDEGDVKALCELGEAGVLEAQIDLGRMYDPGVSGDETQKDYAEALKWYSMASEQGDLYSKIRLVQFYAFGLGTQKSLWKAFMYVGSYLWAL